MKILGIDYGRKKIGLAIGQGGLAEPWKVIRYQNIENLEKELGKIIDKELFDKIVVGVSEGEMAVESKRFAESIGAETFDETLTSVDAQKLSIEAGLPQAKRHEMEDAFAASIMLQSYLDHV